MILWFTPVPPPLPWGLDTVSAKLRNHYSVVPRASWIRLLTILIGCTQLPASEALGYSDPWNLLCRPFDMAFSCGKVRKQYAPILHLPVALVKVNRGRDNELYVSCGDCESLSAKSRNHYSAASSFLNSTIGCFDRREWSLDHLIWHSHVQGPKAIRPQHLPVALVSQIYEGRRFETAKRIFVLENKLGRAVLWWADYSHLRAWKDALLGITKCFLVANNLSIVEWERRVPEQR